MVVTLEAESCDEVVTEAKGERILNIWGVVFIVVGVFGFLGGYHGWPWFMTHRKARFFVDAFGETGARLAYVIVGSVLTVLGFLLLVGIIKGNR
jgi:hypothetical protein